MEGLSHSCLLVWQAAFQLINISAAPHHCVQLDGDVNQPNAGDTKCEPDTWYTETQCPLEGFPKGRSRFHPGLELHSLSSDFMCDCFLSTWQTVHPISISATQHKGLKGLKEVLWTLLCHGVCWNLSGSMFTKLLFGNIQSWETSVEILSWDSEIIWGNEIAADVKQRSVEAEDNGVSCGRRWLQSSKNRPYLFPDRKVIVCACQENVKHRLLKKGAGIGSTSSFYCGFVLLWWINLLPHLLSLMIFLQFNMK